MKTCMDCKFSIETDYGYSNYTVEGTEIDCIKNKNDGFPVDKFYGEEPKVKFADECKYFVKGDNTIVDCDQEVGELKNYNDDEEVKQLLEDW